MSTEKSQEDLVNDSNVIQERLNFFSDQQNSNQALDSDPEPAVLNSGNYSKGVIPGYQNNDIQEFNQPNQSELDYYEQYKKIYVISYHLFLQKIKQIQVKTALEKRIRVVEQKLRDIEKQEAPKKDTSDQNRIKRSRRTAEEIQRRFRCSVQFCERSYGSEGSLQQHIKLKHPQLYKKYEQREFSSLND